MQTLSAIVGSMLIASAAQGATTFAAEPSFSERTKPVAVHRLVPMRVAEVANEVESLPSGVTVRHLRRGTGAAPKVSSSVRVHYRGTLKDGREFDSSFKRGEPITFPLGGVISCWTQALQSMQVGGRAEISCPSETAYGKRGAGGVIPPNSDLNFEVELLGIEGDAV